ncbi:MAG: DinB family protein [Anaerolineales bacterium]
MNVYYILDHWKNVRTGLLETIDKFDQAELDFKPYAGRWSVRQLILHIAQEENGEFNYGIRQVMDEFPPEYDPQRYPTLESVKSLLASVHAQTIKYLQTLNARDLEKEILAPWGTSYQQMEMIGHLIEHEIHHRGELSLILGILGKQGLDA